MLLNQPIHLDKIHCILFDLDDTLYPHNSGLWEQIRNRIQQFMDEELHFPKDEISDLRKRLWRTYGTTLRGLQTEFQVDMDTYLEYVHKVPLDGFINPEPDLNQLLESLPQTKYIFTNSDYRHANKVLEILGISENFSKIIDIYAQMPYCKPQTEAFQIALDTVGEKPEKCLFVDDSPANLTKAQELGMTTISVGQFPHDGSPHIQQILDLPDLLLYN
ncbi:MAG: pyrimidine 5'-nucleotidase [Anaerolineaceae bacterium]|nr:pyrimidine 5'-nucleotidase [Anaerolineaceae bacterium]